MGGRSENNFHMIDLATWAYLTQLTTVRLTSDTPVGVSVKVILCIEGITLCMYLYFYVSIFQDIVTSRKKNYLNVINSCSAKHCYLSKKKRGNVLL